MNAVAKMTFDCETVEQYPLHATLLDTFSRNSRGKNLDLYNCRAYFDLMRVSELGRELLDRMLTRGDAEVSIHDADELQHGHNHSVRTVLKHFENKLLQLSSNYSIVRDQSLLFSGAFPINCQVYFRSELVAFVDLTEQRYYKPADYLPTDGVNIRRRDQFKYALYCHYFPHVPFHAMKASDVTSAERERVGSVSDELVRLFTHHEVVKEVQQTTKERKIRQRDLHPIKDQQSQQ